jgi:hypothetical protein
MLEGIAVLAYENFLERIRTFVTMREGRDRCVVRCLQICDVTDGFGTFTSHSSFEMAEDADPKVVKCVG